MDAAKVQELVDEIVGVEDRCTSRERLVAVVEAVAALRRWLDGRDVHVARLLSAVDAVAEQTVADATRTSVRDATRVFERAATTEAVPALGSSLDAGDVSAGHVDVVAAVLRQADPDVRQVLVDEGSWIAERAAVLSPDSLRRELLAEVRQLETDGGAARSERRRRACRLRSWVDPGGMWRFHGQLDPEAGLRLHNRITACTEQLYAQQVPDDAPSDPAERQAFLRAHALLVLTGTTPSAGTTGSARTDETDETDETGRTVVKSASAGRGAAARVVGPPEVIVVVDATAPDPIGLPTIDWGLPVELPHDVLRRCFDEGRVSCVVVRNGVILHAPGALDLGRTTRLASRAQRRALRALYPTCAIPGCATRYELCKLHHVTWWEHGGSTDLENLLPLCVRHHHHIHDTGWTLKLTPDRILTITYPDGTTRTSGPPRRCE